MTSQSKPIVLVTGVAGDVGGTSVDALKDGYELIGMDRSADGPIPIIHADFTKDRSVEQAFGEFRDAHGAHIASVIHLAAYFDFSGEENPLYQTLNVDGTRRLMDALQRFKVDQLVYSGTMLVHAPTTPGHRIDESRKLGPSWAYPKSKAQAEHVIRERRGAIPTVLLHLAGLYDDEVLIPTLAHQVAWIYENAVQSHVYPADLRTGQSVVHKDDLARAFRATVDRRESLRGETTILVGEPDPIGYGALQDQLGELIHGREWTTVRVPEVAAAAGAWVQDKVMPHLPHALGGGKPFVRPFMARDADSHYALDIGRAREVLGWQPGHPRLIPDLDRPRYFER
jgi:nucleoside-diphosphate-sugar epimerase